MGCRFGQYVVVFLSLAGAITACTASKRLEPFSTRDSRVATNEAGASMEDSASDARPPANRTPPEDSHASFDASPTPRFPDAAPQDGIRDASVADADAAAADGAIPSSEPEPCGDACDCHVLSDSPRWPTYAGTVRGDFLQADETRITPDTAHTLTPRYRVSTATYFDKGTWRHVVASGPRAFTMYERRAAQALAQSPALLHKGTFHQCAFSNETFSRTAPPVLWRDEVVLFHRLLPRGYPSPGRHYVQARALVVIDDMRIAVRAPAIQAIDTEPDGTPIMETWDTLVAQHLQTRELRFEHELPSQCARMGPPAFDAASGTLLFTRYRCQQDEEPVAPRVLAIDVGTGQTRYRQLLSAWPADARLNGPTLPSGAVLFSYTADSQASPHIAFALPEPGRDLVARDMSDASLLWRTPTREHATAQEKNALAFDGQRLIASQHACSPDADPCQPETTTVLARDPTTGESQWHTQLPEYANSPISVTPQLSFIAGTRLHILDSASGEILHSSQPLSESGKRVASAIAISGGFVHLIVGSELVTFGLEP